MKDCCVFDVTISESENLILLVKTIFQKNCKKWTFQTERGEKTGYVHYQCRISFCKKKTLPAAKTFLLAAGLKKFKISISSTNSLKGEAFYCLKEDTRIDGPWTDQDEKRDPKTVTVLRLDQKGLMEWQGDLLDKVLGDNFEPRWDDRTIHVVYDPVGNKGKTAFCEYMHSYRYGTVIPAMFQMEDIVQFAMCRPVARCYVIDLPRAMDKKNLGSMFAGIEMLKNGQLYDKRYKGVFKWIERPNVIVFTNCLPDRQFFSADRWKIWCVRNKELVPHVDVGEDP